MATTTTKSKMSRRTAAATAATTAAAYRSGAEATKRLTIDITPAQHRELKVIAAQAGVGMADIVRAAIDRAIDDDGFRSELLDQIA